jgi:hypothetical protein
LKFPGLWHHVVLHVATNVLEEGITTIFKVEGDRGNMFLWNVGNHLQDYVVTTQNTTVNMTIILDLPYCCEQWTSSSCCLFLGKMVNMATDPLIVPTRRCSGSSWLDTRGHAIEVTHASCVSMWQSSPVTATFGPSARHSGVNTFKI